MFAQPPLPDTAAQRRFSYVATRRSMAEMERLLHRFLVAELTTLSDEECARMEALLRHPDADLLDWLGGIKPLPGDVDPALVARLVRHAREARVGAA